MPGMPNEVCTPCRPAETLERPRFEMPPGACDAHMHVFESRSIYPSISNPNYTLPDAHLAKYLALMPILDIDAFVIVQPSFYGTDNSCLLDALSRSGGHARGVVMIEPDIETAQIARFHKRGVRGVRMDLFKRAGLSREDIKAYISATAAKIASFGWHLQFYAPGSVIRDLLPFLANLEIDFVIDHMGYMLEKDGLTEGDFGKLLNLLQTGNCSLKLSAPYRLARHSSAEAVDRVAKAIIQAAPNKVLWGSDWPHIPDGDRDTGELLNMLERWAPDPGTRELILVHNPRQLFDFAQTASALKGSELDGRRTRTR